MGLSNDGIDGSSERPLSRAVAKRPILMIAGLFGGLGLLAIALASDASHPKEIKDADEDVLLVPDRASAERLRAQSEGTGATSQSADKAGPADDLGVTQAVAPLPGEATSPGALLDEQQRAQYERYLLLVQQDTLDARRRARSASLRIASFENARRQEFAEASELLDKMSGSDAAMGGLGGGLGALGNLGGLAQAGAAPALAALSGLGGGGGGDAGGLGLGGLLGGGAAPDPNFNAAKKDFFQHGGDQLQPGRLNASVRPASTPYEVQMGTVIPGVLISGINSEAPGQITGQVSENVYDSATGRYLLIPQGSRLVGTYNATVAQGQARVQVAWVRCNFPDGSKLDLGGMSGADQAGTSGFTDQVDRHFLARLAAALMTTALTVAYEVAAPQSGNFYQSAVHRGVGESIVKLGTDMAQQEGQRPPTLKVRPGYRFLIHVSKDVVFSRPYDDGINRRPR